MPLLRRNRRLAIFPPARVLPASKRHPRSLRMLIVLVQGRFKDGSGALECSPPLHWNAGLVRHWDAGLHFVPPASSIRANILRAKLMGRLI